jgi:hypothetical protein
MTRKQYTTRTRYHAKDDEFAKAVGINLSESEIESNNEEELNSEVLDAVEDNSDGEQSLVDADLWAGLHHAAM